MLHIFFACPRPRCAAHVRVIHIQVNLGIVPLVAVLHGSGHWCLLLAVLVAVAAGAMWALFIVAHRANVFCSALLAGLYEVPSLHGSPPLLYEILLCCAWAQAACLGCARDCDYIARVVDCLPHTIPYILVDEVSDQSIRHILWTILTLNFEGVRVSIIGDCCHVISYLQTMSTALRMPSTRACGTMCTTGLPLEHSTITSCVSNGCTLMVRVEPAKTIPVSSRSARAYFMVLPPITFRRCGTA